ncbi:radical SAM protein [Helicobacter mehlei]|uniref:Radical SAM protein n=1 Tax=Helicobacter mehlei TaxID=2316080 RepID=A0A553V3P2_9HELI|nr:radical SAM protein [Helicobacter mehlei]TSA87004.1 radical SAM protein [Helicobacter mehlei]
MSKAPIVFGPLRSRRFGWSLGIDLSGAIKQCNFDCIYCELAKAKPIDRMYTILPLEMIVQAVQEALANCPVRLDVLTTTANGEPTLYPHLLDLICALKPLTPPHTQTLILSNGSLFGKPEVQRALHHYDIVKFSLDATLSPVFKKIDRPSKNLCLESILEGILDFANQYSGMLVAEVLVVQGVNDAPEHIQALVSFLQQVKNLARVDLSTIDRPPSYKVQPTSHAQLLQLATHFENLPLSLPSRTTPPQMPHLHLTPSAFLELLKRRPLSVEESLHYMPKSALDDLLAHHAIILRKVGLVDFYYAS